MKIAFVLGFVLLASFAEGNNQNAGTTCEGNTDLCSPMYSSFLTDKEHTKTIAEKIQTFNTQLVDKSFRFLFMSAAFNRYDMDRPGFKKLYRKISDKAWEDAVDLIKYQSRRGSDAAYLNNIGIDTFKSFKDLVASTELGSLQTALDIEKKMAGKAHEIHKYVSHDHHNKNSAAKINYDPDVAHYLDEKIINYQSGVIRDLAGYVQTLKNFDNDKTAGDLGVHIFDEYLDKTL